MERNRGKHQIVYDILAIVRSNSKRGKVYAAFKAVRPFFSEFFKVL